MPTSRIWAVIPAAGIGRRMGGLTPKQYLKIVDRTIIEHTLRKLAAVPQVVGIIVAISEDDPWWPSLNLNFTKPLNTVLGGAERIDSVANAVDSLQAEFGNDDWIMVHDAARPCVQLSDIQNLIQKTEPHVCGGILAAPVIDTIKQVEYGKLTIEKTIDRSRLWRALTPQLFRAKLLQEALAKARQHEAVITDEASAFEALGYQPLIVEGRTDNIKVTQREDLDLAEFYLSRAAMTGGTQ